MPHTLGALACGRISEWRATVLVRETAYLSREARVVIDVELAGPDGIGTLETMGDQQLVAAVRRVAYRLDAKAVTDRARRAEGQRRVTLRPAPDTMSYLTGLLPVAQGVACLAVLTRAADAARAAGDGRSRGQVMADTLVAALAAHAGLPRPTAHAGSTTPTVYGQDEADGSNDAGEAARGSGDPARPTTWAQADSARADAGAAATAGWTGAGVSPTAGAGVALQLVMTDRALLAGDAEPAHLVGYGPVSAGWARDLLRVTEAQV
jgi:hypothetical protein